METPPNRPAEEAARPRDPVDAVQGPGTPSNTAPAAVPAAGSPSPPTAAATVDAPRVPDDIREAARLAPDHWLGAVDPGWTGDEPPPDWALIGEWRSGPTGQVEEWRPNDDYRPSPRMLGWPEPSDPVDAAVQLAATGYGPRQDAVRALAAAEVTVLRAPDGGPLVATGPEGTPVVPVFTSVPHQPFARGLAHEAVAAGELAHRCAGDGTALSVNPAGPATLVVGADEVLGALGGTPPGDGSGTAAAEAASHPHLATSTGRTP
ncbi:hypothetical protein GCM10018793_35270 [Streptomyces sulfonofaciens]|uniref:SseB protein N-terminal domain-containing protein n=1 Tax=Streptomyces sulfonofaciens TaxID=68272 RepID=A0A919L1W3_9ACTN|nr:type VII secretion system-associated protein [Streptomyces sulfonofaciens]GHH80334.1 hypothetical protein GCM10018793_35270 [Streptomyces sulfonofaciens]